MASWLIAGLTLVATTSAFSQDRLDARTLGNENFWDQGEREAITAFVDRQLTAILSGDEAVVDQGRTRLTDPVRAPGVSERFMGQYTELVSGRLEPLMAAEALKPRLNAMVIAESFGHPGSSAAIGLGLTDTSAGVRYSAARAAQSLLSSGQLDPAATDELLGGLQQLVISENSVHVARALVEAILVDPQNNATVLEVVNDRLAWHASHPGAGFAAESTALQTVYTRLVTAAPAARPNNEVRELARASSRYLLLSAQNLAEGKANQISSGSHQDIIRVAAVALEFAHEELQSNEVAPPNPVGPLRDGDWPAIVQIGQDWVAVLKAGPFNYTDADFALPVTTPQAAAQ